MVIWVSYLMIIMCWFDAHSLFCFNPSGYKGCLFDDYGPYKHAHVCFSMVVCTVFVSLYDVSVLKCDCDVSVVIIVSCVYVSVNLW